MRVSIISCLLTLALSATPRLEAQAIIAQSSGIPNPDHVIDFGANLFPNFTPVSNQFNGIVITHARYFTTGTVNNLVGGFLTNDPIGGPDTLRIQFAQPIHDLSFVYHQISTIRPSVFRALRNGSVVGSFSNLSNQTQPNNYFGFTNLVFDELQIDFVIDFNVDTLAFNDVHAECTIRNGSGINPLAFRCVTPPVLGGTWQSVIGTTPNTLATFVAVGLGGPSPGIPLFGGELLIQPSPAPVLVPGTGSFSLSIPAGPSWLGVQIPTQGLRVDLVGPTQQIVLLNALDLTFGL
ncbi:MAG: hypothetical protein U1F36_22115 [Planctomycetota bacterium]